MRRIHLTIAALVVLALALGFGCMRGWRAPSDDSSGLTAASGSAPAKAPAAVKPALSPSPFDALIDPPASKLFAAAPIERPVPAAEVSKAPASVPPIEKNAPTAPEVSPAAPLPSAPREAAKDATALPAAPPAAPSAKPEQSEQAAQSAPSAKSAKSAPSAPAVKSAPSSATAPSAKSGQPGAPKRIMVAGDSFAVGVGISLAQTLKGTGISLDQRGKTSSGLNSPRFYDWNASLKQFLAQEKPDALVVMLGANDAQNGSGTASWAEDFSQKTGAFIEIAKKAGAKVYWVGLPPMRDEKLNAKVKTANDAMRKACEASGDCVYIASWDVFCDASGDYVRKKVLGGKTVSLRAKDGVHMTMSGYKALGDKILDKCGGKSEISLQE